MGKKTWLWIGLTALILISGCKGVESSPNSHQKVVTVAAATSLQTALEEIGKAYEKSHPEIKLTFIFAGSGTLQKQIEEGAEVDLFISAGEKQMKALREKGMLREPTEKSLVSNQMVVVIPKGARSPKNLGDLMAPSFNAIAMGNPESVPAGVYARETLISADLMDQVNDRVVQAKDVREVLAWVETGNAYAGFVYKTDAMGSEKVDTAFVVDSSLHGPIVYPASLIKGGLQPEEAKAFLAYLAGHEAQALFESQGFSTAE